MLKRSSFFEYPYLFPSYPRPMPSFGASMGIWSLLKSKEIYRAMLRHASFDHLLSGGRGCGIAKHDGDWTEAMSVYLILYNPGRNRFSPVMFSCSSCWLAIATSIFVLERDYGAGCFGDCLRVCLRRVFEGLPRRWLWGPRGQRS